MTDLHRVVVLDDDESLLRGLGRLLEQNRFQPSLFSSVEDFARQPDLDDALCILLDTNLREGSGLELRRRLTAAGIATPVIFMTGSSDPEVRTAALEAGCAALLTKPFPAQTLLASLKQLADASPKAPIAIAGDTRLG